MPGWVVNAACNAVVPAFGAPAITNCGSRFEWSGINGSFVVGRCADWGLVVPPRSEPSRAVQPPLVVHPGRPGARPVLDRRRGGAGAGGPLPRRLGGRTVGAARRRHVVAGLPAAPSRR